MPGSLCLAMGIPDSQCALYACSTLFPIRSMAELLIQALGFGAAGHLEAYFGRTPNSRSPLEFLLYKGLCDANDCFNGRSGCLDISLRAITVLRDGNRPGDEGKRFIDWMQRAECLFVFERKISFL